MTRFFRTVGTVLVVLLTACAATPSRTTPPGAVFEPAADVVDERTGYRIGPDDLLNVVVFQVADLERDVRVDNAGQISLPLIGVVDAAGLSASELAGSIEARYRQRYLQDPQVSVFVKEAAAKRVTVEGAVTSPGIFPVTGEVSLLQTIALAKGLTIVGKEKNVIVFRTIGKRRHLARFDLGEIRAGRAADPQILGNDIVVVDESGGRVWLRHFIELTPLIGVWSVFK